MEAKTNTALEKARKTVEFFNSATDKDVKNRFIRQMRSFYHAEIGS